MSGFCVLLDGAPGLAADGFERAVAKLAFRGPAGSSTWSADGVRMAQSHAAPPARAHSFGPLHIVADARIDDRERIARELRLAGHDVDASWPAEAIILRAFAAWGRDCPRRLLGDFAFALWDERDRSLFCARDPLGVKNLYYAQSRSCWLVSNTLDCVRCLPGLAQSLNHLAIADFLLFERPLDATATAFSEVTRLGAGHTLTLREGRQELASYWTLKPGEPPARLTMRDAAEGLAGVLKAAVSDRLREGRAEIAMSGGLDSTAVAALAREVLGDATALRAHTIVFEDGGPDPERAFAKSAAVHLGLQHDVRRGDGYLVYHGQRDGTVRFPEPRHNPQVAISLDSAREAVARGTPAILTGWDGDSLLDEQPRLAIAQEWRHGRRAQALVSMMRLARERPAAIGRQLLRLRPPARTAAAPLPAWISRDLAREFDLHERWAQAGRVRPSAAMRPLATTFVDWMRATNFFSAFDAEATSQPIEYRHPFADLRVIGFCLSLPAVPWCLGKKVLREAMAPRLPAEVCRRPKTPAGDKGLDARIAGDPWFRQYRPSAAIARYVDVRALGAAWQGRWSTAYNSAVLRPLSLDLWLRQL